MNRDAINGLILAAHKAYQALTPASTEIDRQIARNGLDRALKDIKIDAEFRVHSKPEFDGETYDPLLDGNRLRHQLGKVFEAMMRGEWLTLEEIQQRSGQPQASISARLRDLRKPRFGSYILERRPRGERDLGQFEYRLLSATGGPVSRVILDTQIL